MGTPDVVLEVYLAKGATLTDVHVTVLQTLLQTCVMACAIMWHLGRMYHQLHFMVEAKLAHP